MNRQRTGERSKNRVLLMFYDSLALVCVWFVLFAPFLSEAGASPWWQMLLNLLLALAGFLGLRLLLRVYKQMTNSMYRKMFTMTKVK